MGWFESKKKINLPGFMVNAFGKLPFYKEYLYICPEQSFAELKAWVDDRFERLSRQGTQPPYLAPNRHFMIHSPQTKTDLVGSIWESNDGMRTFPFMLAASLPRKIRKYGFPLFWQVLNEVWTYFERYGEHLRQTGSSTAFYKGIRGVVHQLPKIEEPYWPKVTTYDEDKRERLATGGLIKYDLRGDDEPVEQWFANLGLKNIPQFILWPQQGFESQNVEAFGYVSMMGAEALALDLFQPIFLDEPDLDPEKALAHGAAIAAAVDAAMSEAEDTSEEETLILKKKEKEALLEQGCSEASEHPTDPKVWEATRNFPLSEKLRQRVAKEKAAAKKEIPNQDQATMPLDSHLEEINAAGKTNDALYSTTLPLDVSLPNIRKQQEDDEPDTVPVEVGEDQEKEVHDTPTVPLKNEDIEFVESEMAWQAAGQTQQLKPEEQAKIAEIAEQDDWEAHITDESNIVTTVTAPEVELYNDEADAVTQTIDVSEVLAQEAALAEEETQQSQKSDQDSEITEAVADESDDSEKASQNS